MFSALLALYEGNPPVTGGFPSLRPVTRSFDVFFDMCLTKRLSKQSRRRWFETPSCLLWRHCNDGLLWFQRECLGSWSSTGGCLWSSLPFFYSLWSSVAGACGVITIRNTAITVSTHVTVIIRKHFPCHWSLMRRIHTPPLDFLLTNGR